MNRFTLFATAVSIASMFCFSLGAFTMDEVAEMKMDFWNKARGNILSRETTHAHLSVSNAPQACVGNSVTIDSTVFSCSNVDFLSYVSLRDLEISTVRSTTNAASDMWGWLSPTGKEITIEALDNGVVFVDSTDPVNPIILAKMESGRPASYWTDVKVYKHVAYVVKDTNYFESTAQQKYGIEVFDLLRLEGLQNSTDLPLMLTPDFVYAEHGSSHNLAVNADTGFLYSLGTQTCKGGLHMIDLNADPLAPVFAGCASSDGYTHDAQCVLYNGPDTALTGKEICFAFNEDSLTIWDVTVKSSPVILSRACYPEATYTHQGWLTDDMSMLLIDDELDEVCGPLGSGGWRCDGTTTRTNTTTYYIDVSDLSNPKPFGLYEHPSNAIDHNLYVWGSILKRGLSGSAPVVNHPSTSYAYFANYASGLRVADVSRINSKTLAESGHFDVAPETDGQRYLGAWSTYMHPSGVIAVSSIERGLFFLNFTKAFVEPTGGNAQVFTGSLSNTCPGPTASPTSPTIRPTMSTAAPSASPTKNATQTPSMIASASPVLLRGSVGNDGGTVGAAVVGAMSGCVLIAAVFVFRRVKSSKHGESRASERE